MIRGIERATSNMKKNDRYEMDSDEYNKYLTDDESLDQQSDSHILNISPSDFYNSIYTFIMWVTVAGV